MQAGSIVFWIYLSQKITMEVKIKEKNIVKNTKAIQRINRSQGSEMTENYLRCRWSYRESSWVVKCMRQSTDEQGTVEEWGFLLCGIVKLIRYRLRWLGYWQWSVFCFRGPLEAIMKIRKYYYKMFYRKIKSNIISCLDY